MTALYPVLLNGTYYAFPYLNSYVMLQCWMFIFIVALKVANNEINVCIHMNKKLRLQTALNNWFPVFFSTFGPSRCQLHAQCSALLTSRLFSIVLGIVTQAMIQVELARCECFSISQHDKVKQVVYLLEVCCSSSNISYWSMYYF